MTTIYLFHKWIEESETSNTVISVFGHLWDGDAAAAAVPSTLNRIERRILRGVERGIQRGMAA